MNVDVGAIFGYLAEMAGAIIPLFSIFGVLAGLVIIGKAIGMLIDHQGQSVAGGDSPPLGVIGLKVFIGAALLQFSTSVDWNRDLLGGVGSGLRETMAFAVPSSTPIWSMVLSSCMLFLVAVGLAGSFKGFILWNKAASGDRSGGGGDLFWAGLWHLVGGAICINIGM